jgi:hypothetical protein
MVMLLGTMVMPSGFKWNEQQQLALGTMVMLLGTMAMPSGFKWNEQQ